MELGPSEKKQFLLVYALSVPQHDFIDEVGRIELEHPRLWIDSQLLRNHPVVEHPVLVPPDELVLEELLNCEAVFRLSLKHAFYEVCDVLIHCRPDWFHKVEVLLVRAIHVFLNDTVCDQ